MKINDNPAFNAFDLSIKKTIKIKTRDDKSLIVNDSMYLLIKTFGVLNAFIIKKWETSDEIRINKTIVEKLKK